MNRTFLKYTVALIVVLMLASAVSRSVAASPQWWQTEARESASSGVPGSEDAERIEVEVQDGDIFITVGKEVQVKVFTILGQLVTQRTITPGTTRLRISAKGIYILKIGPHTRRINL